MALDVFYTTRGEKVDKAFLNAIYYEAIKHFDLKDIFEVEVTIVGEEKIRTTNLQARGIDKVTDVLSFPSINFKFPFNANDYIYDIDPETGKIMLGEIMLCEKRAKKQAKEYGHSVDREIGFLVLHGLLHLMGFDHMTKDEEKEMMSHAEAILKSLKLSR